MPQIFRNATMLLAPCDCTQTVLSRAVSMRSQMSSICETLSSPGPRSEVTLIPPPIVLLTKCP